MNPSVQIPEILLQMLPLRVPRQPVHPAGGPRVQRPIGRPQAVDVDVVQERGEPCFPVLLCNSAHALQRTWRALPGSVSRARFAGRVPLGQPPSLHRLRRRNRGVVRRLRPRGRIVANSITLEGERILHAAHHEYGGDLVRLEVGRAEPLGSFTAWRAGRPVVQWSASPELPASADRTEARAR
jgi:hypothetical protein